MNITEQHVEKFRNIVNEYQSKTDFPIPNNWTSLDNNDLWLGHVGQIILVGSSVPNAKFLKRPDLKERVSFHTLAQIPTHHERQVEINSVLQEIGDRWASKDLERCNKSRAISRNYTYLTHYPNGFKGLFTYLTTNEFEGSSYDMEYNRVKHIMKNFMYLKDKSARDFLMTMGINSKTLALDVRIQNIFKHFRVNFPDKLTTNVYNATEKNIIDNICTPIGIEPVKFDRILYQHYSKIVY